ncbi:MAG: hypothetical protein GX663_08590 [Clostridiales bacterium]|nr:hypothetical protein [Clostridiales bacterium]
MDFYNELANYDSSNNPVSMVLSLTIVVLSVIAYWRLFTKAGEAGWKAIIPVYNSYMLFKLAWKVKWFVISLIGSVVCVILMSVSFVFIFMDPGTGLVLFIISLLLLIFLIAIGIAFCFKLSAAYGHGIGYGFGLLFLSVIFLFILAFGSSQYVKGAQQ